MNYRHIYHAGNICDVVKHSVLTVLLGRLLEKDKPIFALDTHAGIGLYDLLDARAAKTDEAKEGIFRLLKSAPISELAPFYVLLQKLNPNWVPGNPESASAFRYYTGSPYIINHFMRPEDRLVATELHEDDHRDLQYVFHDKPQTHIHHRDGYEALKAFLPPPEKRGLVLIDPPYEKPDEFDRLPLIISEAYKRWPQGQFVIWYPIKDRPTIWSFHEKLVALNIPKILSAEFIFQEELRADRLNGSGLILINPLWKTDMMLKELFLNLHKALKPNHEASHIKWLTPE